LLRRIGGAGYITGASFDINGDLMEDEDKQRPPAEAADRLDVGDRGDQQERTRAG
jgi:hypothetical protein